jgi:hypothetical protein
VPIDPSIFLRNYRPVDIGQILDNAQRRRALQIQNQSNQMAMQEQGVRLSDMLRTRDRQQQIEGAARNSVTTPQPQTVQQPTVDVGGVSLPGGQSTVQGPPTFDQNKFNSAYQQIDPIGAQNYASAQQKSQLDQNAAIAEVKLRIAQADKATQEAAREKLEQIGRLAQGFKMLPPEMKGQAYQQFKGQMEQTHGVPVGFLPEQYTPQVDQVVDSTLAAGQSVHDFVMSELQKSTAAETNRHNMAMENRQTPGVNVPFPPAVEAQKARIAKAGKPDTFGSETLTPQQQDLVDQIGTGKMPLTRLDYLATRNPGLLSAVSARYPDFDGSKIKSYVDATKDFTSGKTATQINAGATALGHLQELRELNTVASHIPHTPAWTKYQNKVETLATELAKFYGDATIPAIASIKETLGSTLPGNREAAIQTQAQSMGDKFDSFEQQWKNAAPSANYQAPVPGMSDRAKAARAALDPNYKARAVQGITVTDPAGGVHIFPDEASAAKFRKAIGGK